MLQGVRIYSFGQNVHPFAPFWATRPSVSYDGACGLCGNTELYFQRIQCVICKQMLCVSCLSTHEENMNIHVTKRGKLAVVAAKKWATVLLPYEHGETTVEQMQAFLNCKSHVVVRLPQTFWQHFSISDYRVNRRVSAMSKYVGNFAYEAARRNIRASAEFANSLRVCQCNIRIHGDVCDVIKHRNRLLTKTKEQKIQNRRASASGSADATGSSAPSSSSNIVQRTSIHSALPPSPPAPVVRTDDDWDW